MASPIEHEKFIAVLQWVDSLGRFVDRSVTISMFAEELRRLPVAMLLVLVTVLILIVELYEKVKIQKDHTSNHVEEQTLERRSHRKIL